MVIRMQFSNSVLIQTPLIGYVNSDIVFDESLAATINAALDFGKTSSKQVAIVGRRFNVDVPKELFAPPGKVNEQSWDAVLSVRIHVRTHQLLSEI